MWKRAGFLLRSALDAAGAGSFELGDASELHELRAVLLVGEGGEHAGEVADRGDGWADAAAEWFAGGGAAEVVVAAGAGRLRHELQLPVPRLELVHRLGGKRHGGQRELAAVRAPRLQLSQRALESFEILLA